jgi:creatinine amidohydrolase
MQAVAKTVAAERGAMVGAGSYWKMASRELARCGVPTPQRVPGHAGAFETSMLMALRPDLVSADLPARAPDPDLRDPDGFTIDSPTRRIGVLGRTDDPSSSTAEYGLAYVEAVISGVHRSLEEYWAQCETGESVDDVSQSPSGR